ncbi:hypothetical protein AABB24_010437 [Solanum stoloniferum]|uniref:Uncharacterized protein n=1 Tax=Solanum stoloniferum TaxID=62892 RepID=A0ABD2UCG5_9SOLN|nr:transcription factor MYB48-like [Solanum verrucosum]XP_049375672.1 transcription factor MYB48-like [Solanum verrucosum]XP_049375673.1 transcription factor MYB48-like [Solanum verrucosum]
MTPQEERLILELHSKWGNRWSRIAMKLPGRTDNEIKNYWRTHMRKKAHDERKNNTSCFSPSSSFSNSSSFSSNSPDVDFTPIKKNNERNFYDTGGFEKKNDGDKMKVYSMDEIWKDIELSQESETMNNIKPIMPSPICNYCPNTLWMSNEEETKMFPQFYCLDNQDNTFFAG